VYKRLKLSGNGTLCRTFTFTHDQIIVPGPLRLFSDERLLKLSDCVKTWSVGRENFSSVLETG